MERDLPGLHRERPANLTKKKRNRGHFWLSWQWAILLASPDRYGPWEVWEDETRSPRNERIIFQPFQVRGQYCWFQSLICFFPVLCLLACCLLNESRWIRYCHSNPNQGQCSICFERDFAGMSVRICVQDSPMLMSFV